MQQERDVEHLIEQIVAKLRAHEAILARSVDHGRLSWRRDAKGRMEIKIQPEL